MIQRAGSGTVSVAGSVVGSVGTGLVVLLGVGREDTEKDAEFLAEKTVNLRIFPDAEGKMNLSCLDIGGGVLVVSQFTLFGDCRKGRRPNFTAAADNEKARALYEYYVDRLRRYGVAVATGEFREEMEVVIHNQGPVTILLDSKGAF